MRVTITKRDNRNLLSQRSRSLEPETRVLGNWGMELLSGAGKALPQASVLCPVFTSIQHSPVSLSPPRKGHQSHCLLQPVVSQVRSPPEVLNQHPTSGEASEHHQPFRLLSSALVLCLGAPCCPVGSDFIALISSACPTTSYAHFLISFCPGL